MDLETLTEALGRAEAARKPLAERLRSRRQEADRLTKRQEALAKAGHASDRPEYLRNAEALYDACVEKVTLEPIVERAQELEHALRYLPSDWHAAMPGRGMFVVRFFVRNYRIEEGKPVAFDPFWIETCIRRDGKDDETNLRRHAAWASGVDLRPGGNGPSDPIIRVRKPFGTEAEAARAPCGACGASGYVLGFMELGHWSEDEIPYRQTLSVMCLACPVLTPLAERSDYPPVRLYP